MTEDDDKKEILSSDEKGAAKSTLGGAVAGAVVGTAVGTPVVGTLIGAVSGAVMAARKRRAKNRTKRSTKAKTSPAKKRAPAKAAARQSPQRARHEGRQSRQRKRAALRLGESAPSRSHRGKHAADVLAPAGVVTCLIGNHAVYTMLGHHQRLVLVNGNDLASAEDRQIRTTRVNPNAPPRRRAPNL
jgi:hypothetical protein